MELLLEHGARAAVHDEVYGLTPLITAIRGSDLSLREEIHGGTPLDWCVRLGRPRLRALLEEAEGR